MAFKIGEKGLDLIKSFESLSLKAYKGPGEAYYTIGYGHYNKDVKATDVITKKEAEKLLKSDLSYAVSKVNSYACPKYKLNQNQFDALVSYLYNRGIKGFTELISNSDTVKDLSKNIVVYWGTNEKVKKGIMRRRNAEKSLFDTPVEVKKSK